MICRNLGNLTSMYQTQIRQIFYVLFVWKGSLSVFMLMLLCLVISNISSINLGKSSFSVSYIVSLWMCLVDDEIVFFLISEQYSFSYHHCIIKESRVTSYDN